MIKRLLRSSDRATPRDLPALESVLQQSLTTSGTRTRIIAMVDPSWIFSMVKIQAISVGIRAVFSIDDPITE